MKNRILITLMMLISLSLFQAAAQDTGIIPKSNRGKWGYVSSIGKTVIDFKYRQAHKFNQDIEDLAKVQTIDNKWGYIDKTGKEIIACKYDNIENFDSDGLAKVKLDGKSGYIDKTGKEIIPCKYDYIEKFVHGSATANFNNKIGRIDKTGKEIIPCKYDAFGHLGVKFPRVKLDGKWGYIDETGKEVIPCKYDDSFDFSDGVAGVKLDTKWGCIDETGKEIIPFKYDNMKTFGYLSGLAEVEFNNKIGLIDKTGKEIIPCKYDYISAWRPIGGSHTDSTKIYEVWVNGQYGKIDRYGKETEPLKYKNQQMQVIWENLLIPHVKQINTYRLKSFEFSTADNFRTKSSSSFTIKRPYLLVSTNVERMNWENEMEFSRYSENNFGEQSANDVKTLVVHYNYHAFSQDYVPTQGTKVARGVRLTSYGSYLVYFDVEGKECTGYDLLPRPELPPSVSVNERVAGSPTVVNNDTQRFNSIGEIIKTIESRLMNPAE